MNICFFLQKDSPLCLILPQLKNVKHRGGCYLRTSPGLIEKNKWFFFFCFFNRCLLLGTGEARQALTGTSQSQPCLHPVSTHRMVRMEVWTSTGGVVVGVCCSPPDEEQEVDEVFFRHLEESLQPQVWLLMSEFNHHTIC